MKANSKRLIFRKQLSKKQYQIGNGLNIIEEVTLDAIMIVTSKKKLIKLDHFNRKIHTL